MFAFPAVSSPSKLTTNYPVFNPLVPLADNENIPYTDLWYNIAQEGGNIGVLSATSLSMYSEYGYGDNYLISGNQVTYTPITVNNLGNILFNNVTNTTMTGNSSVYNTMTRSFDEYTIILVVKPTGFIDVTGYAMLYATNGALPSNTTVGVNLYMNSDYTVTARQYTPNGTNIASAGGSASEIPLLITSTNTLSTTDYNIIIWRGLNIQCRSCNSLRVNGIEYFDQRYDETSGQLVRTYINPSGASDPSVITRIGGDNTYSYRGHLGLFGKLNKAITSEYASVIEGYLASIWESNVLPSNHPYKDSPLTTNLTPPTIYEKDRLFTYIPAA